jgi:hypothetical protein
MGFKDVISLDDLNNGAAGEQWTREWKKVIGNISDPSTDAKKVRKITLEVAIAPTDDRSSAKILITTKSALAPAKADENMVMFEKTDSGVIAMTREPEKQLELDNITEFNRDKAVR